MRADSVIVLAGVLVVAWFVLKPSGGSAAGTVFNPDAFRPEPAGVFLGPNGIERGTI